MISQSKAEEMRLLPERIQRCALAFSVLAGCSRPHSVTAQGTLLKKSTHNLSWEAYQLSTEGAMALYEMLTKAPPTAQESRGVISAVVRTPGLTYEPYREGKSQSQKTGALLCFES